MSDYGWESIDRGDWTRRPVKPMTRWTPGTRIPPLVCTDPDDGPREDS
jgi:hypothetical protein